MHIGIYSLNKHVRKRFYLRPALVDLECSGCVCPQNKLCNLILAWSWKSACIEASICRQVLGMAVQIFGLLAYSKSFVVLYSQLSGE